MNGKLIFMGVLVVCGTWLVTVGKDPGAIVFIGILVAILF